MRTVFYSALLVLVSVALFQPRGAGVASVGCGASIEARGFSNAWPHWRTSHNLEDWRPWHVTVKARFQ